MACMKILNHPLDNAVVSCSTVREKECDRVSACRSLARLQWSGVVDAVTSQALAALRDAVAQLIPAASSGGVDRRATALPLRIAPVGIGGLVVSRTDPTASIFGRRIEADIRAIFTGGSASARETFAGDTLMNVLSLGAATLREAGFLNIKSDAEHANDVGQQERTVRLKATFEFIATPAVGEGVIEEIPTRTEIG